MQVVTHHDLGQVCLFKRGAVAFKARVYRVEVDAVLRMLPGLRSNHEVSVMETYSLELETGEIVSGVKASEVITDRRGL